MPGHPVDRLLKDLLTVAEVGSLGALTDAELLERFVARREAFLFDLIVRRHGPMVWGICRRVLRDHHDAEDAFQATFLVLARKASSVQVQAKLEHWLARVATLTARKARAVRLQRAARHHAVAELAQRATPAEPTLDDLVPILDRELDRLPDRYRLPIVLCELEGKTHRQAAEQLGWPVGTVSGRLHRGRSILAGRLARAGVTAPEGVWSALLATSSRLPVLPPALMTTTVQSACLIRSGQAAASLLTTDVFNLVEGVLATMRMAQCKLVSWLVLPVGLLLVGVGVVAQQPGPTRSGDAPASRPTRNEASRVDETLNRVVDGRIIRVAEVVQDGMILAYMPGWAHGNLDNLGIANNDGGVRTLVNWPDLPPDDLKAADRRFLLAFWSRKTSARGKAGPILAFELNKEWPERTSWQTRPDYAPEPAATFSFEPNEGWKLFDITPMVRQRAEAGRFKHGLVLRFLSEDKAGNGEWSGYEMVSREGVGEWANRRPCLLIVDPKP